MLFTLCRPCAAKLQIFETLLSVLGERPCAGCGTTVGYARAPMVDGAPWLGFGPLVAPYTRFWQWAAWPIAWGLALQDGFGTHVHEWSVNYWNGITGEQRESCRCHETRVTQGRKLPALDRSVER